MASDAARDNARGGKVGLDRQSGFVAGVREPMVAAPWPASAAWLYVLMLLLSATVFSSGCSDEKSASPFEAPPDTSFLRIMDVGYLAISHSEPLNSGVHIWWKEYFFSNYDKNCAINRYVVINPDADTIFDREWENRIIHTGGTNIGRTKWIDLADSAVEGHYTLNIFYHHSRRGFEFDTSLSVIVNYP